MNRESFLEQLHQYKTDYREEQEFVPLFIDILSYPNAYERSLLERHLTASAWVIHPDQQQVLLLHHAKLNRWLQPGGHADGDEDLLAVARKEVEEETGLKDLDMIGDVFFDLDIHTIPARKGVPEHDHYDVRFAFIARDYEQIQGNHESNGLEWVPWDQVEKLAGGEASIVRMVEKQGSIGKSGEQ